MPGGAGSGGAGSGGAGSRWSLDLGGCEPAVLAVAQRAQFLADQVRVAAALVAPPHDDSWRGRAAALAAVGQQELAGQLRACASQLDDVAAGAAAHARAAGSRADELEQLARRAQDLLDDVLPGSA